MRFVNKYLLLSFLTACGHKSNPSATPATSLTTQISERVSAVRQWAPTCNSYTSLIYPAKEPNGQLYDCGDGDSTAINGIVCLSGASAEACEAVRLAVDSDGRLWRSPFRVGKDPGPDTSSRDQLNGLLAYLVRTKDKATATRFYDYLKAHDYDLCPDATDNRCTLVPLSYGEMAKVWRHIGLSPSIKMVLGEAGFDTVVLAEVETAPVGYQLNDAAEIVLKMQKMGLNSSDLQRAADIAHNRAPNNPFYAYLSNGATDDTARLFLETCPTQQPESRTSYSTATDNPGINSMGWEFISLAAFMEGK